MAQLKVVKDIMLDVFNYPHLPYWFTIRQAIGIAKKVFMNGESKCHDPMTILVFDEKYNLMGTLSLKDILKGLEPRFLQPVTTAQVPEEDESGLALLWEAIFTENAAAMADQPVGEVLTPVKHFVRQDDPITRAAHTMIHNDLLLLPVLDDNKFVGVVRMIEIFDELSGVVLTGKDAGTKS